MNTSHFHCRIRLCGVLYIFALQDTLLRIYILRSCLEELNSITYPLHRLNGLCGVLYIFLLVGLLFCINTS